MRATESLRCSISGKYKQLGEGESGPVLTLYSLILAKEDRKLKEDTHACPLQTKAALQRTGGRCSYTVNWMRAPSFSARPRRLRPQI